MERASNILLFFSPFSALSTEKFNRAASSRQNEFFTVNVHRYYELKGTGRILRRKRGHV